MKKTIAFLTGIACIFSLTACANSGNNKPSTESSRVSCGTISAGEHHTIGVRADGTVAAAGWNEVGQCDVSDWTDIIAVSAGTNHTVGLKSDGTVVAVGDNFYGECDVSDWKDIVAVSAGTFHTVGLKSDGTVVATTITVEDYDWGQCDVSDWTNIRVS